MFEMTAVCLAAAHWAAGEIVHLLTLPEPLDGRWRGVILPAAGAALLVLLSLLIWWHRRHHRPLVEIPVQQTPELADDSDGLFGLRWEK